MVDKNKAQNKISQLFQLRLRIIISHTIVILGYILIITLPPSTQGINFPERQTISSNRSLYCPKALGSIPNVCDRFKCFHNITKQDCPLDTFFIKNLTLCGCCPGCVKFLGPRNESIPAPKDMSGWCTNSPNNTRWSWEPHCQGHKCPKIVNHCLPGLICNENTGVCSKPPSKPDCNKNQECMYKKSLKRIGEFHWDPDCEEDGSYAPKQCKGDPVTGICFCVDKCGRRIFGQEFRGNAKNQTCECSRQVYNLRDQGNTATMHCTSDGNYEPLQCDTDSRLCYCVDEKTGKLNGAVVPEAQWKKLPCLTQNTTNFMRDGRYLRKCESIHAANLHIIREGKYHGDAIDLQTVNCDYDGSYAPLQKAGTRTDCVYKNRTTIRDFFANSNRDMDCNCARDQFLYQITGRPFSFACDQGVGNYPYMFDFGSFSSCIDRDGIAYGDLVPSKYSCCLKKECARATESFCYDALNNPKGYKACCVWPYGPYEC